MSASGLETLPIGSIGIATAEALGAVKLLVAPTSNSRPDPMPKKEPRTDEDHPKGGAWMCVQMYKSNQLSNHYNKFCKK
jgi:hypothetical protein